MIPKQVRNTIFVLAVILSVYGLFTSPLEQVVQSALARLTWLAVVIAVSETMLAVSYVILISVAVPSLVREMKSDFSGPIRGVASLGRKVREIDWRAVADKCNESRSFWVGFWLSVAGAYGNGAGAVGAVILLLPSKSWAVAIIPLWNMVLTFVIRRAIFRAVRRGEKNGL